VVHSCMNSIKLKCYCFRQHTSKYPPHFWWVYKGWPMKLILHKQLVTFTVLFKKTFPNVMLRHIMLTQNMYRHHHDLFQPSSSHYSNSELFLELLKDSLPRSFFLFLCWSIIQNVNPLAPELFLILAHPVYKMWIIQEPNKLALWNILHFEEKKTESTEHV